MGHSFAAPSAMMMKSGSYESPKPYILVNNLKNSRIPLLTSVRMSWKVAINYINLVWMILNRTQGYIVCLRGMNGPKSPKLCQHSYWMTPYNILGWILIRNVLKVKEFYSDVEIQQLRPCSLQGIIHQLRHSREMGGKKVAICVYS